MWLGGSSSGLQPQRSIRFHSGVGHMSRLRVCERQTMDASFPIFLLPLSIKINKSPTETATQNVFNLKMNPKQTDISYHVYLMNGCFPSFGFSSADRVCVGMQTYFGWVPSLRCKRASGAREESLAGPRTVNFGSQRPTMSWRGFIRKHPAYLS